MIALSKVELISKYCEIRMKSFRDMTVSRKIVSHTHTHTHTYTHTG